MTDVPRETIRVLHVDDDPDFVDLTATFLERADDRFTVETATTVDEGLERLGDRRPDCIVSDYEMPGRDGLELLQEVRDEHPDLPFVLFTGRGSEAVASEAVSAGVTDYLQKGTGSEQYELLANRVTNAVAQFRTERELRTQREQLERHTDLFRKAQTLADVGAWEWYPQRGEGYYSKQVYEIYAVDSRSGRDPDGDIDEFYHPDDRETLREAFRRAVENGESYDLEVRVVDADGTQKWVRTRGDPQFEGGECVRIRGTIQDITDRREREWRLNRLQQRTRALMHTDTPAETAEVAVETAETVIDAPLCGVHLLNGSGDALEPVAVTESVADAFEGAPVYRRAAPAGTRAGHIWEVFESGNPLRIDDASQYDQLTETAITRSVLVQPIGDHGVLIVSAIESGAFTETDETLVEILATTLRSALDRVTRDEHRRQREQRLRRLHDVTLDLARAEGDRAVAELAVEGAEEVLGFPLVMVRRYDDDRGGLVPVASSERVGDVFDDRPVFRPGDGSFNWEVYETGEATVFDDINQSGRAVDVDTPLRSLAIFSLGEYGTLAAGSTEPESFDETDVFLGRILATATGAAFERVGNREQLRQQRDELERKNSRLEAFTDTVSHDLRSPLVVAEGQLELARAGGEDEHLTAALDAIERGQVLVDDLLALARTDDRTIETEPVALDAASVECWQRVDTGSATLEVDADRTILADRSRLQQLLANLYRNSVEHGSTSPDSQARQDSVEHGSTSSRTQSDDAVEQTDSDVAVTIGELDDGFYVEDDGPGIPGAARGEVFDAGYTTTASGTGLGLRIVEEIATAHGWSVRVTDGADGGARFEITGVTVADE